MLAAVAAAVRAVLVCEDGDAVRLELSTVEQRVVLVLSLGDNDAVTVSLAVVEKATRLSADRAQQASSTGAAQQEQDSTAAVAAAELVLEQQRHAEAAAALQEQHAGLMRDNLRLQGLVRQYLDGISKATCQLLQDVGRSTAEGAEQQTRYSLALQQLRRLVAQREAAAAAAAAKLAPEQARLAAAVEAADAQRAALQRLVLDVVKSTSMAAATGAVRARLPDSVLQRFLAEEPAKAARCRMLRAAAARLAHRLAAVEQRLREADQLSSEGLHLVDFEQARIETAALTSKREAREAEVQKLRGRLVQTVQITAHVNEKLHCVQQERAQLAAQLQAAEAALAAARTDQDSSRARAELLRHECSKMREDWRVVSDRRCLDDMRAQQEKLEALQAQAATLQARYEAGERTLRGLA